MSGSKFGNLFVEPLLNAEKKKPPDLRDDRGLSYFASRRGRGGRGMPGWLALNLGSAEAFATPAGHQGFMAPPVVPAVVDRIG